MSRRFTPSLVPAAILGILVAVWLSLGVWISRNAPYSSGTDESIRYVAFAAAKNRWATEEDFRKYHVDHFYYPPLYFLCFAPFYGDEPSFADLYPEGNLEDDSYIISAGTAMVSEFYLASVPPVLLGLYRKAKLFSLSLGLIVLLSLAATLWLLFPGRNRWWYLLLGTVPVLLLPQFLYYHTLVNNDSLLNALSALAILGFVGATLALERGHSYLFTLLSAATAASIGLSLFTKMSGAVLLPLVPALVGSRWLAGSGEGGRRRYLALLLLLLLLVAALVAAGGWWIVYKAVQGDWSSSKAHQLAHPWAFESHSLAEIGWLGNEIIGTVRSYFALFTGALISVPDTVFVAYLLLPGLALVAAVLAAVGFLRSAKLAPWRSTNRFRAWIWLVLALLVGFNFALLVMNTLSSRASYGRLMFPSLAASHSLFALLFWMALRHRRRLLVVAALLLTVYLGGLFTWTFSQRMVWAVSQPRENLRVLSFSGGTKFLKHGFGPVWKFRVEQPLTIPAGNLAAIRIEIIRKSLIPQFRAAVRGSVVFGYPGGKRWTVPLKRAAIGDNDFCLRWLNLELEKPVSLSEPTPAILMLQADPPLWYTRRQTVGYASRAAGFFGNVGPATLNGKRSAECLGVAVVYLPQAPGARSR